MSRLNALVIGNAKYDHGKSLKNPINDAHDIAEVLKDGGFAVSTLTDATFKQMKQAIKAFEIAADNAGTISLFFFAGHGVEVDGVNYLIAKDTEESDKTDVETGALSLDEVIRRMEPKGGAIRTNIIILDACRDNPFDRKWRGKSHGLAPVYAPRGTLIAFATSPGQFAGDGDGRNGLYTEALLKHISEPDLPIEAMFKRVRNSLGAKTKQKQISWEHTSLAGEFYFHISAAASVKSYSPAAIKDKIFALDSTKRSHRVITALKSYNWYTQNPALEGVTAAQLEAVSLDSLFVLGRNILQAASGSAKAATDWITRFRGRTQGMSEAKRKALLDGILFEIFFDSDGGVRKEPKVNCFEEVFDLAQYPEFDASFEFIASALASKASQFFAIPGKGHKVTVDVQLGDDNVIEKVFVAGTDYLKRAEEASDEEADPVPTRRVTVATFEGELCQQMLVPSRLLKVVYNKDVSNTDRLRLPYDAEVIRPN